MSLSRSPPRYLMFSFNLNLVEVNPNHHLRSSFRNTRNRIKMCPHQSYFGVMYKSD